MNNSYYAIIPATVRYDKDLTFGAKMLYGEITALANQRGYCYAQNAHFAKLYELSTSTISRWISKLVNKGYLKSEIILRDNTHAVEERRLYISDKPMRKDDDTPTQNCTEGIRKNEHTPIRKNAQGNNTSINTKLNNKSIGESTSDSVTEQAPQRTNWKKLLSLWNDNCHLNSITDLTTKRKQMLGSRLKEHGEDSLDKVIKAINNSNFLKGQNDRNWSATFDWVIKPSNYVKILEGNYNDLKSGNTTSGTNTGGVRYGTIL